MKIPFEIGDLRATFVRDPWWGGASLEAGGETVVLADPRNLSTQLNFNYTRTYTAEVAGRNVAIVHTRPVFLSGLRRHSYSIYVDDKLVAQSRGF